ncbi:MAG: hypothetical protein IT223_05090 [Crocinitomicaceae bacterium]|nr:hypothetical protein [Crocinitomicaceae bacterium]
MKLKHLLFFSFLTCLSCTLFSQGVGINTTNGSPDPSAGLDINFNDRGILIPRLTQIERDAIVSPATGLQIYNTTTDCINLWNGSSWRQSCYDCDFTLPAVGNNGPLCEGATLNLTASSIPGAIYSWSGPGGFSSTLQNPSISNVTASYNGIFSLIVTVDGCTSNAITTLATVNSTPATPVAGSNSPVCTGAIVTLTASNIIGATYNWTGPNGFTANQQNPSITNANIQNSGVYNVAATINGCTGATGSTSVTVASNPGSFSQTTTVDFDNNTNTNVSTSGDEVKLPTTTSFGTGADGAYTANSNTTLTGGTYNFTTFTIAAGVTVRGTGSTPIEINCTGAVSISGTLDASGYDGMSGRRMTDSFGCGSYDYPNNAGSSANPAGGAGGPGGFAGANGASGGNGATGSGPGPGTGGFSVNGSGGGGGFGSNGLNGNGGGGTGGSAYGDTQLSTLQGGSGGGAGAGFTANMNDGGAGGGGGGTVKISSPDITINSGGSILANGGGGGGGDGAGGGGAGGAIWLSTGTFTNLGSVQADGGDGGCASPYGNPGGNGGSGRIRLDYSSATLGGSISPLPGYTGSLSYSLSPGSSVTSLIAPANLCHWGLLNYSGAVPAGTTLSVDILDNLNNPLATGITSGTNLANIPAVAAANAIKLRAALGTTNPSNSPSLQHWSIDYVTQ